MFILAFIAASVGGVWVATKVFPSFGQAVRIHLGKLVGGSTSPVDKERDQYEQLKKRIPEQRNKVAAVIASSNIAKADLATLKTQLGEAERRYKMARTAPAGTVSEETINTAAQRYSDIVAKIELKEKELQAYSTAAANAVKIMEDTAVALEKFKNKIDMDASTENLTDVLNMSAEATQQARDLMTDISNAGSASAEVRRRHEEAIARNTLAQGTTADREMEELDRKSKAQSAREELDAKLGLGPKVETPVTVEVPVEVDAKNKKS